WRPTRGWREPCLQGRQQHMITVLFTAGQKAFMWFPVLSVMFGVCVSVFVLGGVCVCVCVCVFGWCVFGWCMCVCVCVCVCVCGGCVCGWGCVCGGCVWWVWCCVAAL